MQEFYFDTPSYLPAMPSGGLLAVMLNEVEALAGTLHRVIESDASSNIYFVGALNRPSER